LEEAVVRSVALDVHRDFCEVAVVEEGELRSCGRIATTPEQLELFAQSLGADDRVALEVTGNAWEIARLIEPHVARVLVVSPSDTGIRQARAKTDRLDARTLARLLAAGSLDAVWMPDRDIWVMRRRLSRRGQLVRARSAAVQPHIAPDRQQPGLNREGRFHGEAWRDHGPVTPENSQRLDRFGVPRDQWVAVKRRRTAHLDDPACSCSLGGLDHPALSLTQPWVHRRAQKDL
jgi:hypothetical protein